MKKNKFKASNKKISLEDLRYLQRKISGSSVYSNMNKLYNRRPKYKKLRYYYQD